MNCILVVEDDEILRSVISEYLYNAEYKPIPVSNVEDAMNLIDSLDNIKLIITDLKLPGTDGMELSRYIRKNSKLNNIPIMMMTGKNDITTKYLGFEAGADDFISKPFEPMEFLLKIKSLLRRTSLLEQNKTIIEKSDNTEYHESPKNTYITVNGNNIYLTPIESEIFKYFYTNSNRLVTNEELMIKVMKYPRGAGNPEVIRTHIKNIRKKIEVEKNMPQILTNIPKKGYLFDKSKLDLSKNNLRFN